MICITDLRLSVKQVQFLCLLFIKYHCCACGWNFGDLQIWSDDHQSTILHSCVFSASVLLPSRRRLQRQSWRLSTKVQSGFGEPLRCVLISCRRSSGCGRSGLPILHASWQTALGWARRQLSSPLCNCSGGSTADATHTLQRHVPCSIVRAQSKFPDT